MNEFSACSSPALVSKKKSGPKDTISIQTCARRYKIKKQKLAGESTRVGLPRRKILRRKRSEKRSLGEHLVKAQPGISEEYLERESNSTNVSSRRNV